MAAPPGEYRTLHLHTGRSSKGAESGAVSMERGAAACVLESVMLAATGDAVGRNGELFLLWRSSGGSLDPCCGVVGPSSQRRWVATYDPSFSPSTLGFFGAVDMPPSAKCQRAHRPEVFHAAQKAAAPGRLPALRHRCSSVEQEPHEPHLAVGRGQVGK